MRAATATAALAIAATGCAPIYLPTPGTLPLGTVFQNSHGPLAYRSPTEPGVVRTQVTGEACSDALVVPPAFGAGFLVDPTQTNLSKIPTLGIAWGDAGIARAVADAKEHAAGGRLYDVRIDAHTTSVLGVYLHLCTEVHATVAPPT
jgi:hypothetical protein